MFKISVMASAASVKKCYATMSHTEPQKKFAIVEFTGEDLDGETSVDYVPTSWLYEVGT
jgi:hypothetical protein